jgi:hypothetical protein
MTQIHLYNHAEDAWEANLSTWLEERSRESLSGHQTWFVVGSYLQANWVRRMALTQNKALFGIQFFDRRTLRQHLCHLFGLPSPTFGRETLQILLEAAAGNENAEYTVTHSLLSALDSLGASGYLDKIGLERAFSALKVPESLQPAVRELTSSLHWSPRVDSILLERIDPQTGLHLGLFGLDSESFGDLNLILAAVKHSIRSDLWIAQPLGKEELMFNWITTLEQRLKASTEVCPTGSADRPFEAFLTRWQGAGVRQVSPPEILVGNRWNDQLEAIVHRVAKALMENARSVLVVVPENSPTGRALVHRLISRGFAVADEVRETKLLPVPSLVQTAISQFLSEDRTPENFLRIIQCLLRSQGDYLEFRGTFLRSFEERQVRAVPVLVTEAHRERFPWIRDLDSVLEPWPVEAEWNEFRRRWEALLLLLSTTTERHRRHLIKLTLSTDPLEPLWHEIGTLMQGRQSTSRLFLKFVTQLLGAQAREPHPGSHHRYAKISVATAAKAFGTSWDCVILADSIADGWPVAPLPNSVLSDEQKIRFRKSGFFMLTSSEQRQIQEERFLQLAYHARAKLILARYEKDEKGLEIVANNLATFSEEFLKTVVIHFQAAPYRVRENVESRFKEVCADRVDPGKPFDDHFLNFKTIPLSTRAWYPSELEKVFKTPGTFAFTLIFGCRREFDRRFVRSAQMTVGRIAHRLLQQAFTGSGKFQAFAQTAHWSREEIRALYLSQIKHASSKMQAELAAQEPDLWWETILGKAASMASRMLDHVSERFGPDLWYQSEAELKGVYSTATGKLELDGRADLILSNRSGLDSAILCICDFKTSKQPHGFDLKTGNGLQFLGYRLLAEANKGLQTEILIVKPDGLKTVRFPPDEGMVNLIDQLARLQRERSFGRRPSERWEASEVLPIATLPLDAGILESKLELTWK